MRWLEDVRGRPRMVPGAYDPGIGLHRTIGGTTDESLPSLAGSPVTGDVGTRGRSALEGRVCDLIRDGRRDSVVGWNR